MLQLGYQDESHLKNSKEFQKQAKRFLPAGVAEKIFIEKAQGSHIWDADGNEYIDYKLGYGPVILGHGHPAVQERVHEYDQKGVIYGFDHQLEIDVARKLSSLMPSAEIIRYFVTGTEATMNAIKIARAYTGKDKVIKFEGHYHGFHDYVSFSVEPGPKSSRNKPRPETKGIPRALQKLIIVREWNDFDSLEKAVKSNASTIAAIIAEPVMANSSVIPPQKGYLKFLRELCNKNNIVLIFDEVKTGFRIAKGGAQEIFKIKPDLTALAKSLANGYAISAVVGKGEIMKNNASRDVLPQGTYSRNPISLAAADATLGQILEGKVHSHIERFGTLLMRRLQEIICDKRIDAIIQGYPSMFQILFTQQHSVHNYREFIKCDQELFQRLQKRLLRRGIMLDESNAEPLYLSSSHTNDDLERTVHIFDSSLETVKPASS